MSRFLKVMIVLLAIAAMATPVMAEDMLSLGGQMRVRGWYTDYDGDDYTNSWMDQRLRIGGKLSIAEGVSITFRTDITETNWGANGGNEYGAGRGGDTQQWDRAHIDLTKGNIHVRAGQQYVGYGLAQTINSQDAGIKVDVSGPVSFSAFWLLDDDNGVDTDDSPVADSYLYGANV
ncbi:MAG: porin, partial [Desulfuromusa sp.]|nr:porin [Desulfuromusa sp.]